MQKAPKPGQNANCRWLETPVTCGPRGFPYGRHSLYRNKGDGTFADVSAASGISAARNSYGLTAIAGDFDDDGWPDIYVACDSTPSLLFMNNHDGTFREEGAIRGVAYGEDGQEQAGMGAAVGDYDLDGRLDIFKTNFEGDTPDLYRNMGKANFEEASRRAGLAVENRFVCWGAGMVDLDNNGLPDLFMVAGHTFPEIEKRHPEFPAKDPRMLFRNLGKGRFEELTDQAGAAIQESHNSRGCAFGDFDNDGDLDILVINLNEPPSLLRNDVTGNNSWLKVKLVGTKSNRSAIGARVVVKAGDSTQTQEVQSQSSFLSCNDFRLHFGLGQAKSAEVKIRWPNGEWQTLPNVAANQLVTVKEGTGDCAATQPRNHHHNPRRPGRLVRAGEQRSPGFLVLAPRTAGRCPAGRVGHPPLRGSWRATPLFWRRRIELLGSDFVWREDLFSSLLLARFLVAQALKLRKGLLLLGLVAQHSLHLRKPVPRDLVSSIQGDRLLQVRQRQVRLLQRHEN